VFIHTRVCICYKQEHPLQGVPYDNNN
jgi:hypothetical protein